MNAESLHAMAEFVNQFAVGKVKVLDVGSCRIKGQTTTTNRSLNGEWEYWGLDVNGGDNVNIVVQDPYRWSELEDNSFDAVISSNAFEHIEFPWVTITEMARVLKPLGHMCIIAPFVCPTHQHPKDTFRYNEDGLKALAVWAGLEVLRTDLFGWYWNPEVACGSARIIARKPDATIG